jgi:hypothetical protein
MPLTAQAVLFSINIKKEKTLRQFYNPSSSLLSPSAVRDPGMFCLPCIVRVQRDGWGEAIFLPAARAITKGMALCSLLRARTIAHVSLLLTFLTRIENSVVAACVEENLFPWLPPKLCTLAGCLPLPLKPPLDRRACAWKYMQLNGESILRGLCAHSARIIFPSEFPL